MHLNELLKYENENDECENSHRQFQWFLNKNKNIVSIIMK